MTVGMSLPPVGDQYMKSNPSKRTLMILLWAVSLSLSAVAQSDADTEKQPLSSETEMAIMRVMNLENRIQTLQTVPAKMTDNELADHFSGTWICFTTMRLNGQLGSVANNRCFLGHLGRSAVIWGCFVR